MSENLPVQWDKEMADAARVAAAAERPKLASISLRGGIMMYEKVAIPKNTLNCIVVASMMQRLYYKGAFNPNTPASPICFAFHDGQDDVPWVPHAEVHEKQNDECSTCQWNTWGTANEGKSRGKACKEVRKLALIPGTDSKEMALLSVPVTSVKNWSNYVNGLAATAKRPPWGVVTQITVHPHQQNQFEVKFDLLELIDQEKLGSIFSKIGFAKEVLTTPYDYSNPQETMGSDQKGPQKAKKY